MARLSQIELSRKRLNSLFKLSEPVSVTPPDGNVFEARAIIYNRNEETLSRDSDSIVNRTVWRARMIDDETDGLLPKDTLLDTEAGQRWVVLGTSNADSHHESIYELRRFGDARQS